MALLGIDLGTTTLSAVVLDTATRAVLHSETLPSVGFLPETLSGARCQDAEAIIQKALALYENLRARFTLEAVGLTGQMHGAVPLDKQGLAVGPLYTWQDGRGALKDESGLSFCQKLSEEIGCPLAPGYALVTQAYNLQHGLAEAQAVSLSTIAGYLGMRLTGRSTPLLHSSDAASLGGYDARRHLFYDAAHRASGDMLPEVTRDAALLGCTKDGLPVCVAIGDNQASFLGAMDAPETGLLVNIGTGSQVSACTETFVESDAFDTRPFVDDRYLLVASPLCGGRSYALLERFFRSCAPLFGLDESQPLYEAMNKMALQPCKEAPLVDTRFCGTRRDPQRRGSITGLGEDNFTAAHLISGLLDGMACELFEGYEAMRPALTPPRTHLIASGNGAARNPALQACLARAFSLPLSLSPYSEEAARGAALLARRLL